VPWTGLEPACRFQHYPLKIACLPISPPGLDRPQIYAVIDRKKISYGLVSSISVKWASSIESMPFPFDCLLPLNFRLSEPINHTDANLRMTLMKNHIATM